MQNNSPFYFLTSCQFHKKEIFPWERGGWGGEPYANNSLFYFLTSFQFHRKEIFPWEHGNVGGGVGEPYKNNSLFYCLTSFQFHKIEIFPWDHGNIGDILQKNSGADSKHKIVILSEACTKVLHPKGTFSCTGAALFFFIHVLLVVVFLQ